jgi:hypothetical protein
MDKSFDQMLEDIGTGRERLRGLVRELWQETSKLSGPGRVTKIALGQTLIAEKLWTRMQLEFGSSCQEACGGPHGEVALHLGDIAANACLYRDTPSEGFDLEGMKITVFVVRCFNAAMALTQCRLCAAALVWEMVGFAMLSELASAPVDNSRAA